LVPILALKVLILLVTIDSNTEVIAMADEKDRFGETMRLVERAKEDIFFAERDRELVDKLKAQLRKIEQQEIKLKCPKCPGQLNAYSFQGFILDRCDRCGGIWADEGELTGIIRKVTQGPLGHWLDRLMEKEGAEAHK
jgi:Zn-finger nucleic acid-binding protein